MKQPGRLFTLCWMAVLLLLSCIVTPLVSHLGVYDSNSLDELISVLSPMMDQVALKRAKTLAPEYQWIEISDTLNPEAASYIRDYVTENQSSEQLLSRDSNLAWTIHYDGKSYQHNWNELYDNRKGLLDYTISSKDGIITYQGDRIPARSFDEKNSILLSPALLNGTKTGSTDNTTWYSLKLPDDFSIRFYIPENPTANGEIIAATIRDNNRNSLHFALSVCAGILLLFIFLWKAKDEMSSSVLQRFTQLKALPAWLLLAAGSGLMYSFTSQLSDMLADGRLKQLMRTFGFAPPIAGVFSSLAAVVSWFGLLFIISLAFLYFKYVFYIGFGNYLKNETVLSWWLSSSSQRAAEAAGVQSSIRSRLLLMAGALLYCIAGMGIAWFCWKYLGWEAVLLAAAVFLVFVFALAWRFMDLNQKNYAMVLHASDELASGNFTDIHPAQAGQYQAYYNNLLKIASSYQKALDDGLSSQISKTQLISNVSHDLKTPVTGIINYSELIQSSEDPQEIKKYAARLESYAGKLSSLIQDLFDLAKASSGDIQLSLLEIDLVEMILQVESDWEDTLQKKNLRLIATLPKSAPACIDPDLTVRIIDNLLSNVSKYAMENTRVFLSLEAGLDSYVLTFKNTSKTQLDFNPEEIVERFVRGDRSRHEPGTGLGLAIVKSFAEIQSGSFEVDIDGDLFKGILRLPRKAEPKETPSEVSENEKTEKEVKNPPLPVQEDAKQDEQASI